MNSHATSGLSPLPSPQSVVEQALAHYFEMWDDPFQDPDLFCDHVVWMLEQAGYPLTCLERGDVVITTEAELNIIP